MVCSGDAASTALAGLLYELSSGYPAVEIEIRARSDGCAEKRGGYFGAPLMQDYAVISLSDLLIPWETIEKRLRGASLGDFVVVLYNPASRKRTEQMKRACDIFLESRSKETICGVVRI